MSVTSRQYVSVSIIDADLPGAVCVCVCVCVCARARARVWNVSGTDADPLVRAGVESSWIRAWALGIRVS